jgi:hypothetical protein
MCSKYFENMLNRNKQDINSYVNSNDLERYLSHLRFDNPFVYRHSDLPNEIDSLFQGNNSLAIILLNDNHPSGVGHYVALRKDGTGEDPSGMDLYTWFDCLGNAIPDDIQARFQRKSKVEFTRTALMSKKENLCGKYCIAFANAGNIPLPLFASILTSSKSYSADQLVANLYRLNYGDNVLEVE